MVLTLNSRYPLVWRSPSSLQLGVAHPMVVLTDVSVATERMLAALAIGVSEPGLLMIGRSAGAEPAEIDALVLALGPALRPAVFERAAPTVLLVGSGLPGPTPLLDQLSAILAAANVDVRIASDAATVMAHDGGAVSEGGSHHNAAAQSETSQSAVLTSDLAIAISHFVLAPPLRSVWLRRDIPHLSVNFSDTRVEVGPIIEPGHGPCLYCIERHRADSDSAWPAIATQLFGRRSALESGTIVGEIAAIVARLAIARLAAARLAGTPGGSEHPDGHGPLATLEIDAITGARSEREWTIHPECGCAGLVS